MRCLWSQVLCAERVVSQYSASSGRPGHGNLSIRPAEDLDLIGNHATAAGCDWPDPWFERGSVLYPAILAGLDPVLPPGEKTGIITGVPTRLPVKKWAVLDLNQRPPRCQRGALAN